MLTILYNASLNDCSGHIWSDRRYGKQTFVKKTLIRFVDLVRVLQAQDTLLAESQRFQQQKLTLSKSDQVSGTICLMLVSGTYIFYEYGLSEHLKNQQSSDLENDFQVMQWTDLVVILAESIKVKFVERYLSIVLKNKDKYAIPLER